MPAPESNTPQTSADDAATFAEPGDLFASTAWMDIGACRGADPDLFFPEPGVSLEPAKEVCRGCAVKDACLEFAVVNHERFGVWGGTSERERRRIRRARKAGGSKVA